MVAVGAQEAKKTRVRASWSISDMQWLSINYRFSQQAIFPAQIYDCKAAVRWVRANANQYNFDPERIGAWGLSAGGHLVSLLGTAADVDSLEGDVGSNSQFSSQVQAVCDWYGPSNFPTLVDYPSNIDRTLPNSPEALLIGGAIPDNLEKARAASPITYVSGDEPPFFIMHGTENLTVPFHQSVELDSALQEFGDEVQFIPKENTGHGGGLFTSASTNEEVLAFFETHLKSPATSVNRQPTEIRSFTLDPNYPNPFNPSTTISYELSKNGEIELAVFNLLGQKIRTLYKGFQTTGLHQIVFHADNLAAGIYIYQIRLESQFHRRKLLLLK